jgi:hypothetical protein
VGFRFRSNRRAARIGAMLVHTHPQRASMQEPSRVRQHLRFRCLNFRLASSSIGEGQERCPWWVPGLDGPRSTLARSNTHVPE